MARERLQKLIAAAGICSRRRAEDLLRSGRVRVNGAVAQLGDRADPEQGDAITLDGRPLAGPAEPLLLLVNKPVGLLSTCSDPHGRPTVLDLLPADLREGRGLHPIGRLDADSRGALLLTNQGDLTLRLSHPRYGHRKRYRVWVTGVPSADTLKRWAAGVPLDGRPSQPVAVRVLRRSGGATCLEVVMGEGRNRQIRRTAEGLGHPVRDLQRVAIGPLRLGNLPEGHWRALDRQEWQALAEHPS
ncbi:MULTISPECIES: pseudouridine synthase [Aphanothece]|uniref:pseudouridine synthase n=1 Tax=Aphanothece TaxID=1121 RepID=UPI0039847471